MLNKQFILNFTSSFLSMFIGIGIGFVLTPYLVKTLGVSAYGFFPLANNFIGYAGILTVALNAMGSRFIILHLQKKEFERASQYFNTLFFSNCLLALLILIVGVVFSSFIHLILDVPKHYLQDVKWLFYLMFFSFSISLSTSIFSIGTTVANRLDINAYRNILSTVIRGLILFLLFYLMPPKLYYVGIGTILASIFLIVTNYSLLRKYLPEISFDFNKFRFNDLKELVSSGLWVSINQLSILLLTQLDLLLVNVYLSAEDMGELSVTKIIPSFIQSIVGMVVGVFVPKFMILFGRGEKDELLKEFLFSIKFVSICVVVPVSFFIIYGLDFYHIYVPTSNYEKINQLSILTLIPMIVTGSINTLYNIYTVTNKNKVPALVWVGFGILNTLFVISLFKFTNLGLYAIPLTSFILGLARNLIFTPIYGAKCLEVKWNTFYNAILKGLLCGILMIVICAIFKYLFKITPSNFFQLIIISIITGLLGLVGGILINFNISSIKEGLQLLKNKIC